MAKPELGTKRVCPTTGRKFYDLNKDPIVSPYTGMVVPLAPVAVGRGAAARSEPKEIRPDAGEEILADEVADVELISLEEADDDEAADGKKTPAADEELEIEDEIPGGTDDDAFLEEDEDVDVDAAELIDGDLPDEEEA